MPLLNITNLRTSPIGIQDPTGYSSLSISIVGSGSVTNLEITDAQLDAIQPSLDAMVTASHITYTVSDDPAQASDSLPLALATATASPYNAGANDECILTNRGTSGAMSVVLSASAPIGQPVRVVDLKGDAASNNVTITVAGGGTINGGANLVLNVNKSGALLIKTGATAWVAFVDGQVVSAPTGSAGGDLTGSYPNPTLATIFASAPAALSGPGTIDVTKRTTLFTSTGAGNALVLPDGTKTGQRLTLIHTVKGTLGTGVVTPTNPGNFATATVTNKWDWFEFEWSGAAWNAVGGGVAPVGLA